MEKIIIHQKKRNTEYPIFIGEGILSQLRKIEMVKAASSVVIITDTIVAKIWIDSLKKELSDKKIIVICIKSGEKNKTLVTLSRIWKKMLKNKADRFSLVITLGGGVVCDIGGLAAGTFMRGIPVIHIPTTLLAQVDASVGGKTAIDFCGTKNSIGIFNQPSAVIIDAQMLNTLPRRQVVSGLAEVVKHAIIADKELFDSLSKIKISTMSSEEWIQIISRSVNIKKTIVEQDETEKNSLRKQLNFGHTVGHAIESLSLRTNNPLLHGEAIAIGMVAETRMSRLERNITEKEEGKIISLLKKNELPVNCEGVSITDILQMIQLDKKNKGGKILWSLPFQIGKVKSDCVLNSDIINKGILSIIKK